MSVPSSSSPPALSGAAARNSQLAHAPSKLAQALQSQTVINGLLAAGLAMSSISSGVYDCCCSFTNSLEAARCLKCQTMNPHTNIIFTNSSGTSSTASAPLDDPLHSPVHSLSVSSSSVSLAGAFDEPADDDDEEETKAPIANAQTDKLNENIPRELLLEATLKKRSPKGFRPWQSRYCVLYTDIFQYFKKKGDREPQGQIPLLMVKFCHVLRDSKQRPSSRFDLVIGESSVGRTFNMEALTQADAEKWVECIQNAQKKLQELQTQTAAPPSLASLLSPKSRSSTLSDGGKFWKDSKTFDTARLPSASLSQEAASPLGRSPAHSIVSPNSSLLSKRSLVASSSLSLADALVNANSEFNAAVSSNYINTFSPRALALSVPPVPFSSSKSDFQVEFVRTVCRLSLGELMLARDRRVEGVFYLLHVVKKSAQVDLANVRRVLDVNQDLVHPCLFQQLYWGECTDSMWALYTPPLRQADSLEALIRIHQRLPEPAIQQLAAQLVIVLGFLHSRGLSAPRLSPSRLIADGDGRLIVADTLLPLQEAPPLAYSAPESLSANDGPISDWWRLGVLLFEMAVGASPVEGADDAEIRSKLGAWDSSSAASLKFPSSCSAALQRLVRSLLVVDVTARLGGRHDWLDLQQSEFFSGVDWAAIQSGQPTSVEHEWITNNIRKRALEASDEPDQDRALAAYFSGPPPFSLTSPGHAVNKRALFNYTLEVEIVQGRDFAPVDSLSGQGPPAHQRKPSSNTFTPAMFAQAHAQSSGYFVSAHIGDLVVPQTSRVVAGTESARPQFNSTIVFQMPCELFAGDTESEIARYDVTLAVRRCGASVAPITKDAHDQFILGGSIVGSVSVPLAALRQSQSTSIAHLIVDENTSAPFGELLVNYVWQRSQPSAAQVDALRPASLAIAAKHKAARQFATARGFLGVFGVTGPGACDDDDAGEAKAPARTEVAGSLSAMTASVSALIDGGDESDCDSDGECEDERPANNSNSAESNEAADKKAAAWATRRLQRDGFDLDISFITANVCAMSFPYDFSASPQRPGSMRNGMENLQKFFFHYYDDHYKVYNLASERKLQYLPSKFGHALCTQFAVAEQTPPAFALIIAFCLDLAAFLARDPANVAFVHDKSGKNRSGCFIACYLLFSGLALTASEAINLFARQRLVNPASAAVITVPSQRRFVHQFALFLQSYRHRPQFPLNVPLSGPDLRRHRLSFVRLSACPRVAQELSKWTCAPFIVVRQIANTATHSQIVFNGKSAGPPAVFAADSLVDLRPAGCVVAGEIIIEVYHYNSTSVASSSSSLVSPGSLSLARDVRLFSFAVHCGLLPSHSLRLSRLELEGARADPQQMFHREFKCEIWLDPID